MEDLTNHQDEHPNNRGYGLYKLQARHADLDYPIGGRTGFYILLPVRAGWQV